MKLSHIVLIGLSLSFGTKVLTAQSPNRLDPKAITFQEKAMLECIYNYSVNAPLRDGKEYEKTTLTYKTILQANSSISKFWDWHSFKKDSIIYLSAEEITTDSLRKAYSKYHYRVKRLLNSNIFKNYPNNKITVTDEILFDNFIYTEDKTNHTWELQEDTLTVCGYLCNKAVCNFGGRTWVAWYASEISISDGPWKLYGLPGLILKAEDTTATHSFEAVVIRQSDRPIYLNKDVSQFEISKKQFEKKKTDFESLDPIDIFDASHMDLKGGTTILLDGKRVEIIRLGKYCPLELE
jgi:GLPGLI family protein